MQDECLAFASRLSTALRWTGERLLRGIGGWGGIRTHGRFHVAGFQDRCLKPLGHPSTSGFHSGIAMRGKPAARFNTLPLEASVVRPANDTPIACRARTCKARGEPCWPNRGVAL